jgi:DNA-binding NarL/FixJ family response regulator
MRIVIGEDQVLLREGLARLLEDEGHEIVGSAGDGPDLMRKAKAHRPDLVIADVRMPPSQAAEGLRAALEIRAAHSEMPPTAEGHRRVLAAIRYLNR